MEEGEGKKREMHLQGKLNISGKGKEQISSFNKQTILEQFSVSNFQDMPACQMCSTMISALLCSETSECRKS